MDIRDILISKKFIFAIILAIMGFVLVLLDKTTSDFFFKFIEVIGAGYVVGNISDKINDTRSEIEDIKKGN
jgi:hypothetical protein